MDFLATPEFWVAVSFFLFLGLVFYFGVHKKLGVALDARAAAIAKEIDEARSLREEAEKVLADYRRKESNAAEEAEDIVRLARGADRRHFFFRFRGDEDPPHGLHSLSDTCGPEDLYLRVTQCARKTGRCQI